MEYEYDCDRFDYRMFSERCYEREYYNSLVELADEYTLEDEEDYEQIQ